MSAKINLNLDHATGTENINIYHSIYTKNKRFRISTGKAIELKHWDKEKQQAKRSKKNYSEFNEVLRKQKNDLERSILQLDAQGKAITKPNILNLLDWSKTEKKEILTPIALLLKYIDIVKTDKAHRTAKSYITLHKCLCRLQLQQKTVFFFNDFDENFYKLLRTFINKHDSTFGAYIKNLKAFLNWATDKGYNNTLHFKKWKITNEDGKAHFFLKIHEVQLLANFDFETRLSNVRDLFLIGCYCGLRYSDIISLKPQHVQDGLLNKIAKKTNGFLKIPVIPQLQILLNKYWLQGKELPKITNQKGNEYLKELAKLAGINRPFNYVQIKNRVVTETTFEAWEMVTWHIARYTFITNCIQLNIPENTVMQFVGHKDYKTLKKYIQNDTAHSEKEIMKLSNQYKNLESEN